MAPQERPAQGLQAEGDGSTCSIYSPFPSPGYNNIKVTIFIIIHVLNMVYISSLKKFSCLILVTELKLLSL